MKRKHHSQSGIDMDDIMSTVGKIDFRVTREKFHAHAIRQLTPTKPEKKEETENPKKIHKELLENNEDCKKKKDYRNKERKQQTQADPN